MTYQEYYNIYMKPYIDNKEAIDRRIAEGIEKNRKGDCTVRLTDRNGKPLSNTTVRIKQTSHQFRYGANILMLDEFGDDVLNAKYRDTFYRYFNLATVPFYWNTLEPEYGKPRYAKDSVKIYRRPAPDLCMEYCEEKGIDAKLHCLVYEAFVPEWLRQMPLDQVKKEYERRFSEISERYADKLFEVEVINEVLCSTNWDNRTSAFATDPEMITWSFAMARKYFPNSTLVFNEASRWHRIGASKGYDKYPLLLENAMLKGASVDKIGIQSHLFVGYKAQTPEEYDASARSLAEYGNPLNIITSLDVLGKFGLPLEITEITVPSFGDGEEYQELQAEMLRLWYSIFFSHEAVDTAVYWNTADGHCISLGPHYDENRCRGGLFNKDMTPKKSGLMLKHLFDEEWRTDLTLTTDENGVATLRGFYGNYEVEANGSGAKFTLDKKGSNDISVTIA